MALEQKKTLLKFRNLDRIVSVDIGGGNRGERTATKVNTKETKQRIKKSHIDENKGWRKHMKTKTNFEFR